MLLISFAASGCLAVASAAFPKIPPIPMPAPMTASPAPMPARPFANAPTLLPVDAATYASAPNAVLIIASTINIILLLFNIMIISCFNVLHELPCL